MAIAYVKATRTFERGPLRGQWDRMKLSFSSPVAAYLWVSCAKRKRKTLNYFLSGFVLSFKDKPVNPERSVAEERSEKRGGL